MIQRGFCKVSEKFAKDYPELFTKNDSRVIGTKFLETQKDKTILLTEPKDKGNYVPIEGRINNKRVIGYFPKEYIMQSCLDTGWRVLIPKANGSGTLGEKLSSPKIIGPKTCYTDTYLTIGNFSNQEEARNLLKYLKCKFTRAMLGVLKTTQDNTREKWAKIPLQDFTSKSDIDWKRSISGIDQQLYRKYKLTEEEIKFIETNIAGIG